jgi:glycosyltransferase involved in cell wall biosynthesis
MSAFTARRLRPVRVCFLIDELATAGTETQLLALVRGLDRRRVQPSLCLLRGASAASRALEPADCPVLRLGVVSLRSPATLAAAWRLANFLRRERIDVLQVYFPDSTYFGVPVAWLAGVPAIVRTRNNVGHWLTPLHRRLGRFLNGFTTATIANCEAARQALLATERPSPPSVVVLENGVDFTRFEVIPSLSERRRPLTCVGVVANLRPVKGLDVLIDATACLAGKHPEVTVDVAGEGPERNALQRQIAGLGLEGRVRLRGSVADLPSYLREIDVAVLPSRAEGMSNAVLEYMAAGRAIVATDVGANRHLLADGSCGLLVSPGNPGELAAGIGRLVEDHPLACRLGATARRRARDEFSREAMVLRFEDFYANLARCRVPSRCCVPHRGLAATR